MRCIEIGFGIVKNWEVEEINRNMRCIEIDFLAMIQATYPD